MSLVPRLNSTAPPSAKIQPDPPSNRLDETAIPFLAGQWAHWSGADDDVPVFVYTKRPYILTVHNRTL